MWKDKQGSNTKQSRTKNTIKHILFPFLSRLPVLFLPWHTPCQSVLSVLSCTTKSLRSWVGLMKKHSLQHKIKPPCAPPKTKLNNHTRESV
ncbi:hypothetical protein L6R29_01345 [Myxococcota bacterium]|nr:hypothetical protein [Myxococcota bacterium]